MFEIMTRGLKLGIRELHPVPIPELPLTSTRGMIGAYLRSVKEELKRRTDTIQVQLTIHRLQDISGRLCNYYFDKSQQDLPSSDFGKSLRARGERNVVM